MSLNEIISSMILLTGIIALSALLTGIIGYLLAKFEIITLVEGYSIYIDEERHHLFLTAGWSHSASYLIGTIGGIVLCIRIWRKRIIKVNNKLN